MVGDVIPLLAGWYRGELRGLAVEADGHSEPLRVPAILEFDGRGRLCDCGRVVRPGDRLRSCLTVRRIVGFDDGLLVEHTGDGETLHEFMIRQPKDDVRLRAARGVWQCLQRIAWIWSR